MREVRELVGGALIYGSGVALLVEFIFSWGTINHIPNWGMMLMFGTDVLLGLGILLVVE